MDLSLVTSSWITNYPFENNNAEFYYVGIQYQSVPSSVERNSRTSEPEYPYYEESIGEVGDPDSVVDNSTYIRLQINTLLESSVDHSGRPVRVWLKNPVSPTVSIAFYTGTVDYSSPNNYVDIPYTALAGPLGQTSPTYSISTTAADYSVHVQGVSWFNNFDIRDYGEYAVIGIITGNGPAATPTSFDITDQRIAMPITLDNAYRGNTSGVVPAPGRIINVGSYAVELRQASTSQRDEDPANAIMMFNKIGETIDDGISAINYLDYSSDESTSWVVMKNLSDNDDLLAQETDITLGVGNDTITFNRAGVDLSEFYSYLNSGSAHALVEGSDNNQDGLYKVISYTTTTIDVSYLDGTTVTWSSGGTPTVRIFFISYEDITNDFLATTHSDNPTIKKYFSKAGNGLLLCMVDDYVTRPADEDQKWITLASQESSGRSDFMKIRPGRMVMLGGNARVSLERTDDIVTGWPQYQVDKRNTSDLETNWTPAESWGEWGFDYRGSPWGKDVSSDNAPYQLGVTTRLPYSYYNAGGGEVEASEAFTRFSADELDFTRASFDVTKLPLGGAAGCLIAEIEFSTPGANDGIYITYDTTATDRIQFRKLDGSTPTFPAGTGIARFYGGVFSGGLYAGTGVGNTTAFVQSITPPTINCGGTRWAHVTGDTYDVTDYKFFLLCQNDDATAFGVRDGGQTFARGLTTKSAVAGHGLTQWDQMVTSLLHADEVNCSQGTRDIALSATYANCDVMKKTGGGSWTITGIINKWKGVPTRISDTASWFDGADEGITLKSYIPSSTRGYYSLALKFPQGCTITTVSVRCNPAQGGDDADAFAVGIFRKTWNGETNDDLLSSGGPWVEASGGDATSQTVTFTPDQNNIIDNTTYEYTLVMKSSYWTGGVSEDKVFGISYATSVTTLGEDWFLGF
jgi:hypothetical protein